MLEIFGGPPNKNKYKKFATGTLTLSNPTYQFDITGLAFAPTKAYFYQTGQAGTNIYFATIGVFSSDAGIRVGNGGLRSAMYGRISESNTESVSGTSVTFTANSITGLSIDNGHTQPVPLRWYVFA